jgi:surfactin synthase thioesterase subunit
VCDLPDRQLAEWLTDLSEIPPELLEGERLRTQVGLLRHDLAICATHRAEEASGRLPCPVDAFVGRDDPIMSVADAAAWQQHSAPGGTSHVLPAGHFFTRGEARSRLLGTVKSLIAEAAHRHRHDRTEARAA